MRPTRRPTAPRIARLIADLSRPTAQPERLIDEFWAETDHTGTPLIEPATQTKSWVTFLWRAGMDDIDAAPPTDPVMVMGGPALWWQIPDNVLEPIAGSDVRYRSYLVDNDLRGRYILSPGDPLTDLPPAGTPESVTRAASFQPDPRNQCPLTLTAAPADPMIKTVTYSTFALPAATPRTWADPRPDVNRGTLDCYPLTSKILGNTRRVWIYRPPATSTTKPPTAAPINPALFMLDGRDWIESVPLIPTLDNLIADGIIPPLTVILPEALDTATRYRELTINPAFTSFLVDELIPWTQSIVTLPSDPARTALHGKSYGALAALSAAMARPDVFGTVLCQSGSFWWSGPGGGSQEILPAAAAGHERRSGGSVGGGIRVSIDIGTLEGDAMLGSHRRMADALISRSYPLREHTYHGGHDINCWISELPAALDWWTGEGQPIRK